MPGRWVECHHVWLTGSANWQALDEEPMYDPEDLEMQYE
jgi:hypothetical protein